MNPILLEKPLAPIFLKIPPEHIVWLKFILESYEYLGVLRTLRKDDGIVVILSVDDTAQDVNEILDSVRSSLPFHRLTNEELVALGVVPEGEVLDGNWSECGWLVGS